MSNKNVSPLISIIMNCHNGEKYLHESINSVISQTYKNWELIFWDNSSKDESKNIVKNFSDDRIKYFYSNEFSNLYNARNLAIEKSKGKYVSFLDTDDIWEKRKLEKQIQFLNNSKDFKIVFSNYYTFKDSEKVQIIKHKFNLPSGNITQNLLDYYSLGILTVLLEKSIFDQYKFNKNYNIIGDFEFFITLSQIFKIASIQEPLAYYRLHSSNYSSKKINMHIDELKNWMKKNENELRQKGFNINRQKFFLFKLKVKSFLRSFYKF